MSWLSKWKPLQSLVGGAEGLLAGGPVGAAVGFGGNMLGQGMKGGGGGIWSENLPAGSTGGAMGKTGNLLNYIIPAFQAYKAYQSNKQLEDLQRKMARQQLAAPYGVIPSSPLIAGAGQTGESLTIDGCSSPVFAPRIWTP